MKKVTPLTPPPRLVKQFLKELVENMVTEKNSQK